MKRRSGGGGAAAMNLKSGEHAALLYTDPATISSALGWLAAGLQAGDTCAVLSYEGMVERTSAQLRDLHGVKTKQMLASGQLVFLQPNESHKVLLSELSKHALKAGKAKQPLRLLTCFGWGDAGWPSEDELLQLDSKLNDVCAQHGASALCLYDARQHAGTTLLSGSFECHPLVICRGQHTRTPFFVEPALLQKELRARKPDSERLTAWFS